MKTLNTLKYLLFAISILGLFANMAQNDYSFFIIKYFYLALALVFLAEVTAYQRLLWKQKKSSAIFISIALVCLFILILLIIFDIEFADELASVLGLTALTAVFIEIIIVAIQNRKQKEPSFRNFSLESLGAFFLFCSYYMKNQHWPGANFLMIMGSNMVFFPFFIKSFKSLFREFRNGKLISLFAFLFYFNIALASIGYLFKNMHWTLGGILVLFAPVLLFLLLFPILLPFKLRYKEGRISFINYLQKIKGNAIILFLVLNTFALFVSAAMLKIGPGYYSLEKPPVFQKLNESDWHRAEAYNENYNNFLDNRWNAKVK